MNEVETLAFEANTVATDGNAFVESIGKNMEGILNSSGNVSSLSSISIMGDIISDVNGIAAKATNAMNKIKDFVKYDIIQFVMKRLEILGLRLKKVLLWIKHEINILKIKLLKGASAFLSSDGFKKFAAGLLSVVKALGVALSVALKSIETLLKLIPTILSVDGRCMAFFPTPKSIKKVDIVAKNPNKDVCNKLPEETWGTIVETYQIPEKINSGKKIEAVTNATANGLDILEGDNMDKAVEKTNFTTSKAEDVVKKVETIMDLLIMPEGLPKYEKLKITNLSYIAFLVTSFEKAMNKSFGLPL